MDIDDTFAALISKLPAEYLMVLTPILVVFVVFYVLPRIRRDKQGKLYFYSSIYEAQKLTRKASEYVDQMKSIQTRLDTMDARMALLEEQSRCTVMENLKQTVYIDAMGVTERMYAGLRYIIAYRGNGTTGTAVRELVDANKDVYNSIIALKPDLRLEGV